jgi:hypothetical protein
VLSLHGVEVLQKVLLFPQRGLAGGGMNKAFPLPLAVYFVLRDLLTQQLQSRLVDTIYAAIVRR